MSITLLEAMKLDTFKNFRLIAGHRGLENKIERVGILDYEYDKRIEGQIYKRQFEKAQLVISSLLFAKDDASLILDAIKCLLNDEVSGLAIKNIYYNDLPSEVIELANENSFPIFIFDKSSAYFEDIITDIMDRIKFVDNYEMIETKVEMLMNKNVSKATIRELAFEINNAFKECFFIIYCKEKRYIDNSKIIVSLERMKRNKNINHSTSIFKYRNGIMIISTYEQLNESDKKNSVRNLLKCIDINITDYYIGVSSLHFKLEELNKGVEESIFALKTSEVEEKSFSYFEDIGIYSILMPFINEDWIKNFYNSIVLPIKDYDKKYNTELFNVAVKLVENDGKFKETAEELFLHTNTIRYRIKKIKELLNMQNLEAGFYEQLSIAIKIHKINNR